MVSQLLHWDAFWNTVRVMDELFNISLMGLRCRYSCTKAFDDERRLEVSGLLGSQKYLVLFGARLLAVCCPALIELVNKLCALILELKKKKKKFDFGGDWWIIK